MPGQGVIASLRCTVRVHYRVSRGVASVKSSFPGKVQEGEGGAGRGGAALPHPGTALFAMPDRPSHANQPLSSRFPDTSQVAPCVSGGPADYITSSAHEGTESGSKSQERLQLAQHMHTLKLGTPTVNSFFIFLFFYFFLSPAELAALANGSPSGKASHKGLLSKENIPSSKCSCTSALEEQRSGPSGPR